MTQKEVTELFSVMLLAWPNAEMFKGGVQKLGPTIELWAKCLPDVDFWTGQQALIQLCRVCKFPPSIAEFREQVAHVNAGLLRRAEFEWERIRLELEMGRSPQQIYDDLPVDGLGRLTLTAMGGPSTIFQQSGLFNYYTFVEICQNVIKTTEKRLDASNQKRGSSPQLLPNKN